MKKIAFFVLLVSLDYISSAQPVRIDSSKYIQPMTWTAQQDHDNMKQQLGIKKLRPGPGGNESAPNHANYDESLANPCIPLPDPLITKNGNRHNNKGLILPDNTLI